MSLNPVNGVLVTGPASDVQRRVLGVLGAVSDIRHGPLIRALGCSPSAVESALRSLQHRGLIQASTRPERGLTRPGGQSRTVYRLVQG